MFSRSKGGSKEELDEQFSALLATAAADEPDCLEPQHLEALASKIGVEPDDIVLYILAWKLGCEKPMKITRDEWKTGLRAMRVDSMSKLKSSIPTLRKELEVDTNFRNFYNFVFDWVRDTPQAKFIPAETAIAMWPIIFAKRPFPLKNKWLTFFETQYKRGVSKDLWRQTLEFSSVTLENYDPYGSWPTAMDEFVEWAKKN